MKTTSERSVSFAVYETSKKNLKLTKKAKIGVVITFQLLAQLKPQTLIIISHGKLKQLLIACFLVKLLRFEKMSSKLAEFLLRS